MRVLMMSVRESPWASYVIGKLPMVEPVWDINRNAMDTYCAMLSAAGNDAALLLEDDIILTTYFLPKVEAVVRELGDVATVIQFFSMRAADETVGSRWDRSFVMNQCHYLRSGTAAALAAYAPGWRAAHPEHPTGYDLMMNDWLRSVGSPYWLSVPSLVQHRESKSRLGPRSSKRQSKTFVDPWL